MSIGNVVTAGKGFVGNTVDVVQNNTQGAIGVSLGTLIIWECGARGLFIRAKNRVRNSEAVRSVVSSAKSFRNKEDAELRERLMATTVAVEAAAKKVAADEG